MIDVADLDLPESMFGELDRADGNGAPAAAAAASAPEPPVAPSPAAPSQPPLPTDLAAYLDAVERDILVRSLERHRCNRTAAGASLGLSLRQMRYRMARLGVQVAEHGLSVESVPPEAAPHAEEADEGDGGASASAR